MDIQSKREEVQGLIDNIKEHSDRLKQSQNLPLLELSVILSKITQLHEKTLILKYLAAVDQNHAEEEFGSKVYFKKKLDDQDEELALDAKKADKSKTDRSDSDNKGKKSSDSVEKETSEHLTEEKSDKKLDKAKEESPAAEHLIEITEDSTHNKKGFDVLKEKQELSAKPDLNEAFTEEEDPSLSGQLRKQPIQDLLTAIGLNERYLYANELFDGNIEDFREAIQRLNEFNNGAEAKAFFNEELRRDFGWEKDSEMAKALYLLVERRYN